MDGKGDRNENSCEEDVESAESCTTLDTQITVIPARANRGSAAAAAEPAAVAGTSSGFAGLSSAFAGLSFPGFGHEEEEEDEEDLAIQEEFFPVGEQPLFPSLASTPPTSSRRSLVSSPPPSTRRTKTVPPLPPQIPAVLRHSYRADHKEVWEANRKREEMLAAALPDPYERTGDMRAHIVDRTIYGYNESMGHFCAWDQDYPENPTRAMGIHNSLNDVIGEVEQVRFSEKDVKEYLMTTGLTDDEVLELVHTPEYLAKLRRICKDVSLVALKEICEQYDAVYLTHDSYDCARVSALLTAYVSQMVMSDGYKNAFLNVRPPGHHADKDQANGYCLLNNVAIAAKFLLDIKKARKVLIVDIDVHHGQGTQRIFYNSEKVLYFSIHRYEKGTFWPNLAESNFHFTGEGLGTGFNINVPLNETNLNDMDYMAIILNILMPVAYEFSPDVVFVSAGYDACLGCPEGHMKLTPAFYGHLVNILSGLANGKIIAVLEGGYFQPSLTEGAIHTLKALVGWSVGKIEHHAYINPGVIDTINDVKSALYPHWKCFSSIDLSRRQHNILDYNKRNCHVAIAKYWGKPLRPPYKMDQSYARNSSLEKQLFGLDLQRIQLSYRGRLSEIRLGFVQNLLSQKHEPSKWTVRSFPEVPDRLNKIMERLDQYHLFRHQHHIATGKNPFAISILGSRPSKMPKSPDVYGHVEQIIDLLHSEEYLKKLESNIEETGDVYWNEHTDMACYLNCSLLCALISLIKSGDIFHGIAPIRPPGHHALRSQAGGYCFINNVIIAANYARDVARMKRILILDFDVHHGNGTQQLSYDEKSIMYISVHRYDNGKFYPKGTGGHPMNVGRGEGVGYNVNVAFNKIEKEKMSDSEYINVWLRIVVPLAYSYNPDLIIISAGFDAGINDRLGGYQVTPELFGHLVQQVKSIAPVLLALEGGYNLETTAYGMVNCVRSLYGYPIPKLQLDKINKCGAEAIRETISYLKNFWPILEINKILDPKIRDQGHLDMAIEAQKEPSQVVFP